MLLPLLDPLPDQRSEQNSAQAAEPRPARVWETGVLVQLDIHMWTCTVQLEPHDLGLPEVPEMYQLGRRLLAPRHLLRPVQAAAQRAYRVWRNLTVAFPVGSARFCPIAALPRLLEELRDCKAEFDRASSAFLSRYEVVFPLMREEYEAAARSAYQVALASGTASGSMEEWVARYMKRMELSYPHPAEVSRKFSMQWTLFQLTAPELRPIARGTEAEVAASLAEEVRQQYRERVESFLESAATEIRQRVAEACQEASETLSRNQTVTEHTLEALRRMVSSFRMLNFVGDHEIHSLLEDLSRRYLTSSARTIRELNAVEALRRTLADVREAALDQAGISRITGQLKRRFIL